MSFPVQLPFAVIWADPNDDAVFVGVDAVALSRGQAEELVTLVYDDNEQAWVLTSHSGRLDVSVDLENQKAILRVKPERPAVSDLN